MVTGATGLIEAPDWRWLPVYGNEFVRGLGAVTPRARSGVQPWSGEAFYVNSKPGVKFASATQWSDVIEGELKPVFRRYFSDGVVGRLEVGVRTAKRLEKQDRQDPVAVAVSALRIPVKLRRLSPAPFLGIGESFAEFFLQATTRTDPTRRPETVSPWWVVAGSPLAVCEIDLRELDRSTRPDLQTLLADSDPGSALVEQRWLTVDNRRVSLWFIVPSESTPRAVTRRLRIHVSRLHAEHEAFRSVLRLCDRGRLDATSSQAVRDYINGRAGFLLRRQFAGFPQRELLEIVLDHWETAYADDLTTMRSVEQRLVSPGLSQKVADVAALAGASAAGGGTINQFLIEKGGVVNMNDQRLVDQSVSFSGDHNQIAGVQGGSGNQQTVGSIEQTMNDLPQLSRDLVGAVEELRGQVPDGELDTIADYASSIEDESGKDQPNKGKIVRFAESVTVWAGKVGPPAAKVLGIAAKIAAVVAAVV
jgi:hypothetical protein